MIQHTSDFKSFCKLHGSETHTLCTIFENRWDLNNSAETITYQIRANRFLRGMVRLIVGSSLSVCAGLMSLSELEDNINRGTRNHHMKSAPPEGLALTDVRYDMDLGAS